MAEAAGSRYAVDAATGDLVVLAGPDGANRLDSPLRPNFWRVPTDADLGFLGIVMGKDQDLDAWGRLSLGLDPLPVYLIAVIGNMLPVPFIYLFARKFLIWGYHKPLIGGICKFFVVKGEKAGRALEAKAGRGLIVALLIFVGIPLPGTGAWTGTLAGSILDMKFKDVLIACMGGVLLAGVIIGLASAGLLGVFSALFAV